jgi:hypothetical protein
LINYRDTFQAMLAALLTLSVYNLIEGRNPEARFDELNMQEHNIVELFDVVVRVMK